MVNTNLYVEGYNLFTYQNEVDVILNMMSDTQLFELKDKVELLIKEGVFTQIGFPLSGCGLLHLQNTIMFVWWRRRGKGIKVVCGEVVVCELSESPFWEGYKQPVVEEEGDKEVGDDSGSETTKGN